MAFFLLIAISFPEPLDYLGVFVYRLFGGDNTIKIVAQKGDYNYFITTVEYAPNDNLLFSSFGFKCDVLISSTISFPGDVTSTA